MLDRIKEMTISIGKCLSQKVDPSNPDEINGKLEEITAMLALSSHCVALSEQIYNQKIMQLSESEEHKGKTATDKKLIFGGLASEEIYYMTLSERQNKGLTHRADALRSILSYMKSEHQNLK